MTSRGVTRWLLALAYSVAGGLHLLLPRPFVAVVPGWVPWPEPVVALTGVAELAGAMALVLPRRFGLRKAAGWSLAAYALCVWPANFQHMALDLAAPGGGLGLAYHIPRLAAQPLLIWLALWVGEVVDWPWRLRRDRSRPG